MMLQILCGSVLTSTSCVTEGFLFAMGGTNEQKVLDSGEKYDPDLNTWSPIPPMLQVNSPLTITVVQFCRS